MGNSYHKPILLNVQDIHVGSIIPCGVIKKMDPIEIVPWDEVWEIKRDNKSTLQSYLVHTRYDGSFNTSSKEIELINFNNLNCKCFEDTQSSR